MIFILPKEESTFRTDSFQTLKVKISHFLDIPCTMTPRFLFSLISSKLEYYDLVCSDYQRKKKQKKKTKKSTRYSDSSKTLEAKNHERYRRNVNVRRDSGGVGGANATRRLALRTFG